MFCKYTYLPSSTIQNVASDIFSIIEGETNPAALSAACDQINTSIDTTYDVSGWTLWDNVSATERVYRVSCNGDINQYKYARITFGEFGGLAMMIHPRFSWDNVAHTGLPTTGNTYDTPNTVVNVSTGGEIYLSVNSRRLLAYGIIATQRGKYWFSGSAEFQNFINGVIEADRSFPRNQVGGPEMPYFGLTTATKSNGVNGFACTQSGMNKSTGVVTNGLFRVHSFNVGFSRNGPTSSEAWLSHLAYSFGIFPPTKNNTKSTIVVPLNMMGTISFSPTIDVGTTTLAEVYLAMRNSIFGDTIMFNGKTFACFPFGSDVAANNSITLIVPKG